MAEEVVIIKKRKPKSINEKFPCRMCNNTKDRLGQFCSKCYQLRLIERKGRPKKSSSKYVKTNCKDCNGVRDKPVGKSMGYYCLECTEKRKLLRKQLKNDIKKEIKNLFKKKIDELKIEINNNKQ